MTEKIIFTAIKNYGNLAGVVPDHIVFLLLASKILLKNTKHISLIFLKVFPFMFQADIGKN